MAMKTAAWPTGLGGQSWTVFVGSGEYGEALVDVLVDLSPLRFAP